MVVSDSQRSHHHLRAYIMATLTVACTLMISSCAAVSRDAARVDDQRLSTSDFDDLVMGYSIAVPDSFLPNGNVDITIARGLLQDWIGTQALEIALKKTDVIVTDELRDAIRTNLENQNGFKKSAQSVQDFYVQAGAVRQAASLAFSLSEQDASALYAKGPAISGALCLRIIVTKTSADMDIALSRIVAGESFAAVASALSTDGSAATGGTFTDTKTNSQCLDFKSLTAQTLPQLAKALQTLELDQISTPFEIAGAGWLALTMRPFTEVSADAQQLIGAARFEVNGLASLQNVKIWVSPEYGRWDSTTQTVVAAD